MPVDTLATTAIQADVSCRLPPASNEAPWCVQSGQEAAITMSSCGNMIWTPHVHFSECLLSLRKMATAALAKLMGHESQVFTSEAPTNL